jgi:hypothetical protein
LKTGKRKTDTMVFCRAIVVFSVILFFSNHNLAQNCNSSDLNMLNIPNCTGAINFNSSSSSPLNVDNGQTACTNVSNATFVFNTVNMTPNNNGGSTLIIRNNNNVTITNLNIQNNNNDANITIYVEAGSTLTILNGINTPRRTRFVNYGMLNFGANPSGTITITVQNDNNLFQNAIGATMRFNNTLNFASGNNTRFINNGNVIAGTFTINSNSVRYIQGNNATTTINTLSQNNQTNVLCVPNNTCAKFTVAVAIPQLNNQLTSSDGTNTGTGDRGQQIVCYQGTSANYRGGSVSYPTGVGSAFSTSCATNCPNIILPIELLYFSAKRVNNQIEIKWATQQEKNNQLFEIQRSIDGINFTTISQKQGKQDSHTIQEYKYFDIDFPNTLLYYRLKQVDLDGTSTYFRVVGVEAMEAENAFFHVSPNPAKDYLEIHFLHFNYPKAHIKIINLYGIEFLSTSVEVITSKMIIDTSRFENGIYLLQIFAVNQTKTIKLFIYK